MKIGFLITARLKSSRLPFKVLMDLNGETVIRRIIDRSKKIKDLSEIILCTSTNPQDKPLIDEAKKNDIYYFNGEEKDVLQRLLDAAKLFSLDYILGITADNPLFTIHYSNRIIDEIKRNKYDYVKLEGLPLGAATYGIKVKALETVCEIKNIVDTEIWGYLLNRPNIFDIKNIIINDKLNKPDYRFTLDYKEDYEFLNKIYNKISFDEVINLYDVMEFIEENPEILKINNNCVQKDINEDLKKKINKNFKKNRDEIISIKKKIYRES
mgnify:CR=1 FL=1